MSGRRLITFEVAADETRLLAVDPRAFDDVTAFSLTVSCTLPVCGDGVVELGEACDDGDADDGDGCDAACGIEDGFACTGAPSVCSDVVCGDGVVAGDEACDDGDTDGGDGCDATCGIEAGFVCGGSPSSCLQGTGETCLEALPLGDAAATSFSTTALQNDSSDYSSCGFFSLAGPEAFYAVEVPAGRLLRASLPTAFDGAALALVTDCAATGTSCVAGSGGLGVTSRDVAFANRGADPRTVFVAVDGSLGRDEGDNARSEADIHKAPLIVTEYGNDPSLPHGLRWIERMQDEMDRVRAHRFYWVYEEISQDRWGFFDEGKVLRDDVVDALARASATINGTVTSVNVDDDGTLTVSFTGGGTHEVTLPARVFEDGAITRCDGVQVDATPVGERRAVQVVCGEDGAHALTVSPR